MNRTLIAYRDNKLDQRMEITVDEIARGYWESAYAEAVRYPWPRERSLMAFITAPRFIRVAPGLALTISFDDPAENEGWTFDKLVDAVLALQPKHVTAEIDFSKPATTGGDPDYSINHS